MAFYNNNFSMGYHPYNSQPDYQGYQQQLQQMQQNYQQQLQNQMQQTNVQPQNGGTFYFVNNIIFL